MKLRIHCCVASYRYLKRLTQSDLGKLLGVSKNTVSSWENEDFLPSVRHCFLMCDLFHCRMEDLFVCQYVMEGAPCRRPGTEVKS